MCIGGSETMVPGGLPDGCGTAELKGVFPGNDSRFARVRRGRTSGAGID